MRTSRYLLLLCSLVVCAVPAQDPPQNIPEITAHEAPATFNTRVNLVSVPVVVRDNKGRAVGNLHQEDFRLFDKGKQQIITKFSVNQSAGVAVAPVGREVSGRSAENTNTSTTI